MVDISFTPDGADPKPVSDVTGEQFNIDSNFITTRSTHKNNPIDVANRFQPLEFIEDNGSVNNCNRKG